VSACARPIARESASCATSSGFRRAGTYAAFIAIAAAVVLLPGAPLGLITTGVQALAGVLLPSASVFLLLLCNDRDVLGPWVNPRWLNALAALVVGVLVVLSTLLTITTVFPGVHMAALCLVLFGLLAVVLIAAAGMSRRPPPAAFAVLVRTGRCRRSRRCSRLRRRGSADWR
jgi:natural resistance-associated macrophage protein